ncbi:hypothetical protein HHI36_018171, partial [Cryptolaemus montrouzieri]
KTKLKSRTVQKTEKQFKSRGKNNGKKKKKRAKKMERAKEKQISKVKKRKTELMILVREMHLIQTIAMTIARFVESARNPMVIVFLANSGFSV